MKAYRHGNAGFRDRSQVLRLQHVLADALCERFATAAGVDAARPALRAQVLQHQGPQEVGHLQVHFI